MKVTQPTYLKEHIYFSRFARESLIIPRRKHLGSELAKYYSFQLRLAVEHIYNNLIMKYPGMRVVVGIYGSASRQEMAAHSDADVLIVTISESAREKEFRSKFKKLLSQFDYAKVDIPDWGTVTQLTKIARTNIVEGNQILESKIIIGDLELTNKLTRAIKKVATARRSIRNLLFQWFCYDHYYLKRQKPGLINIKYSHGGTRDILFFVWLAQYEAIVSGKATPASLDHAIILLNRLGNISAITAKKLLNAISDVILLRSETLKMNCTSKFRGLSFCKKDFSDVINSSSLFSSALKYINEKHLLQQFTVIKRTKDLLMKEFIRVNFGAFAALVIKSKEGRLSNNEVGSLLKSANINLFMVGLWYLTRTDQPLEHNIVSRILKKPLRWEVLAAVVTNPSLNADLIDTIAHKIINNQEYGYILKLIAQHPNTSKQTLKFILDNSTSDRYKELARISINEGIGETNFQI